jgi:hypothetical protein
MLPGPSIGVKEIPAILEAEGYDGHRQKLLIQASSVHAILSQTVTHTLSLPLFI